ncbi:MAG: hypothetical protein ACP5OC_05485 [Thermoplasmata archaeon]
METINVFPDREEIALHSEVKRRKMQYAVDFLSTLGESGLAFAGISGSVSYEPKERDDVDIFLIADDGRLWEVILRAFISRRILGMHDICLSLCMSSSYAYNYYSEIRDSLVLEDAAHVIPVYGRAYYTHLLSRMGTRNNRAQARKRSGGWRPRQAISGFLFLLLAPLVIIKGLIVNHRLIAAGRGSESFRTLVSRSYFVLDSEKYRKLMEIRRAGRGSLD